ncbi:hypothetical protein EKI60_06580 [Candidatus Saccharibacteria bacterium]|nr:MAG: hypothetical protein EKI60_06580 [Candidatus Saccharibacteria bacterium]
MSEMIEIDKETTKQCPICHKKMIKEYANYVLTSYPPQYPWHWYCGCGHTEDGGIERGITQEEVTRKQWEKANP